MVALYLLGIAFGLLLVVAAVRDWEWLYQDWDAALLRAVAGEGATRWVCGACGVALVVGVVGLWAR
jgi:hypothetical protein